MATRAQRQWRNSTERALNERDRRLRYDMRQREIRQGRPAAEESPRPLEFDALGFPIPQPIPTFMRRVGRLINGS